LLNEFRARVVPLGGTTRRASFVVGRRECVKVFTLGFGENLVAIVDEVVSCPSSSTSRSRPLGGSLQTPKLVRCRQPSVALLGAFESRRT
jgi:hypothetical protein